VLLEVWRRVSEDGVLGEDFYFSGGIEGGPVFLVGEWLGGY